jgi:PhnB protein
LAKNTREKKIRERTNPAMTQSRKVPEGYHSIQPYLMFVNSQEAIAFFTKIFGAKEKLCMKTPEGRVAHAELESAIRWS